MESYKEKLASINTLIFDVDGVFTNSQLLLMPDGEMVRAMSTRDGFAVQLAIKKGLTICIITGGKSEAVRERFMRLGVKDVFLNVSDKVQVLKKYITENKLNLNNTLYMGDDLPDLHVMQQVGLPCCPVDAVAEIKQVSNYVSPYQGGNGCVRDIIEQVLKTQGLWMLNENTHTKSI